jgi:hypothetical protein
MADVILLFAAALLVLGGAVAVAFIVRSGTRRQALARRGQPARLRDELSAIDDYIRQVSQATADEDLDRLEQHKENNRKCSGS